MRQFAMIRPQFWFGVTGRLLTKEPHATKVLAFYLLTNRHASMIGLYRLPEAYIAHDAGLTLGEVHDGLQRLSELDFAHYDEDHELVWVKQYAAHQIPSRSPKVLRGCTRLLNELPASSQLVRMCRAHYAELFAEASETVGSRGGEDHRDGGGSDLRSGIVDLRSVDQGSNSKDQRTQNRESMTLVSRPSRYDHDTLSIGSGDPQQTLSRPYRDPIETTTKPLCDGILMVSTVQYDANDAALRDLHAHHARRMNEYRDSRGWSPEPTRGYSLTGYPTDLIRRRLSQGLTFEQGCKLIDGLFKSPFYRQNGRLDIGQAFKESNHEAFTLAADGLEKPVPKKREELVDALACIDEIDAQFAQRERLARLNGKLSERMAM